MARWGMDGRDVLVALLLGVVWFGCTAAHVSLIQRLHGVSEGAVAVLLHVVVFHVFDGLRHRRSGSGDSDGGSGPGALGAPQPPAASVALVQLSMTVTNVFALVSFKGVLAATSKLLEPVIVLLMRGYFDSRQDYPVSSLLGSALIVGAVFASGGQATHLLLSATPSLLAAARNVMFEKRVGRLADARVTGCVSLMCVGGLVAFGGASASATGTAAAAAAMYAMYQGASVTIVRLAGSQLQATLNIGKRSFVVVAIAMSAGVVHSSLWVALVSFAGAVIMVPAPQKSRARPENPGRRDFLLKWLKRLLLALALILAVIDSTTIVDAPSVVPVGAHISRGTATESPMREGGAGDIGAVVPKTDPAPDTLTAADVSGLRHSSDPEFGTIGFVNLYDTVKPDDRWSSGNPVRFPIITWSKAMFYTTRNTGNIVWMYGATLLFDERYTLKPVFWGEPSPDPEAPLVVATANILAGLNYGTKWPDTLVAGDMLEHQIRNHKGPSFILGIGGMFANTNTDLEERDMIPHRNDSQLIQTLKAKGTHVAVRGESTARMFRHDDAPMRVMGCPSLMIAPQVDLGARLAAKTDALEPSPDLRILFNFPHYVHENFLRAVLEWMHRFPQSFCVLQSNIDLKNIDRMREILVQNGEDATLFLEGRVRWFTTFESWSEVAASADMAFSVRIHGSMVPIMSGTPAVVITPDERVRELSTVMGLPNLPLEIFDTISSSGEFDDIPDPLTIMKEHPIDGPAFDRNRAQIAKTYVEMLASEGIVASKNVQNLAAHA